jgi:hypothetical protein
MGRDHKEGLDYFPVDVQFKDEVNLIRSEFHLSGVGLLLVLWQKIYGERGYYTKMDSDVMLMFAERYSVGVNFVNEVIQACLRRGIFNREMYDKYQILTSKGIQERYADGTARRTFQKIDGRYLLITAPKNWVIVDGNAISVDRNAENECRNPQSRVEESRVYTHSTAPGRGTKKNVILTDEQYRAICDAIPDADAYIDRFSERLAAKGYRYDDHYKAIMDWWAQDKGKAKQGGRQKAAKGGSFDVDDFFAAAVNRTYQDM